MVVPTSPGQSRESNSNSIEGATLTGSPVVAGSHASVSVALGAPALDPEVGVAIADLRKTLTSEQAALDRKDDETREALALAQSRLDRLEEELHAAREKRDSGRITKLLTGISQSVVGLTGLTTSVDALWTAVQAAIH